MRKAKVREEKLAEQLAERRVEKPRQIWNLHLVDLGRAPIEDNRTVLEIKGLTAGYGSEPVLRGLDLLVRRQDRMALLGDNGSGKSTLVRCIVGALACEGSVELGPSIRVVLFSQEHDDLPLDRTALQVLRGRTQMREEEARTYLHRFLFKGDEVKKPIGTLSFGQQAKLFLALLMLSQANFLILEEPTSHMDMPALEAMEAALAAYRGPCSLSRTTGTSSSGLRSTGSRCLRTGDCAGQRAWKSWSALYHDLERSRYQMDSGVTATTPVAIEADRAAGTLTVRWEDGHRSEYSTFLLRWACPCAVCSGEWGRPGRLQSLDTLPEPEMVLTDVLPVGTYAITPVWASGHNEGIYSFEYLRSLCPCEVCRGDQGRS